MAINVGAGGDDEEVMSAINTTPLVDVMLVLLIIFLITIPVAIHSVPVALPHASNIANVTKPENITVAVDRNGGVFWNDEALADDKALIGKIERISSMRPQPEIQIRGDKEASFEFIARVIYDCQQGGIEKVAFVTEPDRAGN